VTQTHEKPEFFVFSRDCALMMSQSPDDSGAKLQTI